MSEAEDVWSIPEEVDTPGLVLRRQAFALAARTGNLVFAEVRSHMVETRYSGEGAYRVDELWLLAPKLDFEARQTKQGAR